MEDKKKKYPEGHFIGMWIGIGIAMFSGFGIVISFAINKPGLIGIWSGMGVAIGVAIGSSIEQKYKKEGRIIPRTKKQKSNNKWLIFAGLAALLIGIVVLFLFLILR